MSAKNPLADKLETYLFRDEWIAGVLSDLELSPTARLVGVSLGLTVSYDTWPSIPWAEIGYDHGIVVARRLGLPIPIVKKACAALVRRRWLCRINRDGRFHCYDLDGGRS